MQPDFATVQPILENALKEDIGAGDITSELVISEAEQLSAVLAPRQPTVVCGLELVGKMLNMLAARESSAALDWDILVDEGITVAEGTQLMKIHGNARIILAAERTLLNLVQRLSGIAMEARRYAEAVADLDVTILDTRKTTPGLRILEKYAVRVGGCQNHRMGLYDSILIKDNHIAICGSIREALSRAKEAIKTRDTVMPIEVECDTLNHVAEALECGVDWLLLDNMTLDELRDAVEMAQGQAKLEASGGITLNTLRAIAETEVDAISVGALTHSVQCVDIGLDSA